MIFQSFNLLAQRNVVDNVCYPLEIAGVVKEGNEGSEKIKALVDAILSDEVKEYINSQYDGGVVPVF